MLPLRRSTERDEHQLIPYLSLQTWNLFTNYIWNKSGLHDKGQNNAQHIIWIYITQTNTKYGEEWRQMNQKIIPYISLWIMEWKFKFHFSGIFFFPDAIGLPNFLYEKLRYKISGVQLEVRSTGFWFNWRI